MALFSRRERPPADVLARLDPEERVLSWADTNDNHVVLATPFGVWWPASQGHRLIHWQHVDKAIWRDGVLTIIEAEVVDDLLLVDRAPVAVGLANARDLPSVVRKRVESNIVSSEVLTMNGGVVRFVARRRPGHDGVIWWARLESGTRDNAVVRSAVRARLAILRAQP